MCDRREPLELVSEKQGHIWSIHSRNPEAALFRFLDWHPGIEGMLGSSSNECILIRLPDFYIVFQRESV